MNCEICTFDTSADPLMWSCAGCDRKFHAACIGVTVQRNSLRKKERKVVDYSSYIIPCCDACQELLQAKLDFKRLVEQQKLFEKQLHVNTEVTHRLALQQEKPSIVHEAIEGMEVLLSSIKNELAAINKSSSLAGSVVAIKNHMTTIFDTAMLTTKDTVLNTLKTVTSDLSTDLRNINNEISQLNQLSIDLAASHTMNSSSMLGLDILDELKSLSANICSIQNAASVPSSPEPCLSLEVELHNKKDTDNSESGWRLLGTRRVWKADWTEFDNRTLRRLTQQKQAEKARKRKKQARNNNNNNHGHHINNSNRINYQNYCKTNNSYNTSVNNIPNHTNYMDSDINHNNILDGRNIIHNINNHTNNNNNNNNYSSNQRNLNFNNHNSNSCLPPDRELLAAAKYQFSRPPTNYRPTIPFQSGGIINQYPASNVLPRSAPAHSPNWMAPGSSSAEPCEACSCRHSCFPRN